MQLVVLADDNQQEELLADWTKNELDLVTVKTVGDFVAYRSADALIDLLFDGSNERVEVLKRFSPKVVIINSVIQTLENIDATFVRINAWPGFLKRSIVEASTHNPGIVEQVERIFSKLGKKVQWVPDIAGFVTARVIAMIINEAWFTLSENISTRQEIDAAMKLGTNYPYGPFEWCDKIGAENIYNLLYELAKKNPRYNPAALLQKQANN